MSGPGWGEIVEAAEAPWGKPEIADQDSDHDVFTVAGALVYARTGDGDLGRKVQDAIAGAIGTETGGRALALARNLMGYVVAADLIDLPSLDADLEHRFRSWLDAVRFEELDGRTLISTHEDRPNNWGTHAGAARVAADLYLGDLQDLENAWLVYLGFTGNRDAHPAFEFGSDTTWQCDPEHPAGLNPAGCRRAGVDLDGALPDDLRRGGGFRSPPGRTNYVQESLQGLVAQAVLLDRAGYPAFTVNDRAVLRATRWLARADERWGGWWFEGDDRWVVPVVNAAYGSGFPEPTTTSHGKNVGWTAWTHGGRRPADPSST